MDNEHNILTRNNLNEKSGGIVVKTPFVVIEKQSTSNHYQSLSLSYPNIESPHKSANEPKPQSPQKPYYQILAQNQHIPSSLQNVLKPQNTQNQSIFAKPFNNQIMKQLESISQNSSQMQQKSQNNSSFSMNSSEINRSSQQLQLLSSLIKKHIQQVKPLKIEQLIQKQQQQKQINQRQQQKTLITIKDQKGASSQDHISEKYDRQKIESKFRQQYFPYESKQSKEKLQNEKQFQQSQNLIVLQNNKKTYQNRKQRQSRNHQQQQLQSSSQRQNSENLQSSTIHLRQSQKPSNYTNVFVEDNLFQSFDQQKQFKQFQQRQNQRILTIRKIDDRSQILKQQNSVLNPYQSISSENNNNYIAKSQQARFLNRSVDVTSRDEEPLFDSVESNPYNNQSNSKQNYYFQKIDQDKIQVVSQNYKPNSNTDRIKRRNLYYSINFNNANNKGTKSDKKDQISSIRSRNSSIQLENNSNLSIQESLHKYRQEIVKQNQSYQDYRDSININNGDLSKSLDYGNDKYNSKHQSKHFKTPSLIVKGYEQDKLQAFKSLRYTNDFGSQLDKFSPNVISSTQKSLNSGNRHDQDKQITLNQTSFNKKYMSQQLSSIRNTQENWSHQIKQNPPQQQLIESSSFQKEIQMIYHNQPLVKNLRNNSQVVYRTMQNSYFRSTRQSFDVNQSQAISDLKPLNLDKFRDSHEQFYSKFQSLIKNGQLKQVSTFQDEKDIKLQQILLKSQDNNILKNYKPVETQHRKSTLFQQSQDIETRLRNTVDGFQYNNNQNNQSLELDSTQDFPFQNPRRSMKKSRQLRILDRTSMEFRQQISIDDRNDIKLNVQLQKRNLNQQKANTKSINSQDFYSDSDMSNNSDQDDLHKQAKGFMYQPRLQNDDSLVNKL